MKFFLVPVMMLLAMAATGQNDLKLPEITPPSPEAYELTKYGDVPINEFTGMVSLNIPLYSLRAGQLEMPISLNYAGAGVKVDQLSTMTGINWTLSAGGLIARTIYDIPEQAVGAG